MGLKHAHAAVLAYISTFPSSRNNSDFLDEEEVSQVNYQAVP